MTDLWRTAVIGLVAFTALPAHAATIINISTTMGTLTAGTLASGDSLADNAPDYSTHDGNVFVLDEGTSNSIQKFILHYDLAGLSATRSSRVAGSFQIQLANGETFLGYEYTPTGLLLTDPATNGVTYQQTTGAYATNTRGIDATSPGIDNDDLFNVSPSGLLITVNYLLRSPERGLDQARFLVGVDPIPEPASWAMVIAGLGIIGAALRKRGRARKVVLA